MNLYPKKIGLTSTQYWNKNILQNLKNIGFLSNTSHSQDPLAYLMQPKLNFQQDRQIKFQKKRQQLHITAAYIMFLKNLQKNS